METYFAFFTAVFSGFSLFLVWKGYVLAKDYILKHKSTSKVDNQDKYAKLILEKVVEFEVLLFEILDPAQNLENQREVERINKGKVFLQDELKLKVWMRFILPIWRYGEKSQQIASIMTNIKVYVRIIGDEKLIEYTDSIFLGGKSIIDEFQEKMLDAKSILNELKEAPHFTTNRVFVKMENLPNGLYDKKSQSIDQFFESFEKLSKYLDKYIM